MYKHAEVDLYIASTDTYVLMYGLSIHAGYFPTMLCMYTTTIIMSVVDNNKVINLIIIGKLLTFC